MEARPVRHSPRARAGVGLKPSGIRPRTLRGTDSFVRCPPAGPYDPTAARTRRRSAGASTWITRSRSPTSIPSSNVLVATITQSLPCVNASSERRRSSKLSELCETNVSVPSCRRPAASSSTRARLSQKTRRFSPLVERGDDPRRVLDATHIVQLHGSRLHRPAVRCDDAPGPRRGRRKPLEKRLGIADGRGQTESLDLAASESTQPFPALRADAILDHRPRKEWSSSTTTA